MTVVLGIDAAWTNKEPSGVALVARREGVWRALAVAPSYLSFLALAEGIRIDWSVRHSGSPPDAVSLLEAAAKLAGATVDIVAVDMPISKLPFATRRAADNEISKEFGSRWCSAHTPNARRPGKLGAALSAGFTALGYPLATSRSQARSGRSLIEVYPHPALLALLDRPMRVPYKVSKSSRYWPGLSAQERAGLLLAELDAIRKGLEAVFGSLPFALPPLAPNAQLASLKKYEDVLDALVCGWVGTLYASGDAFPLGDDAAAIWCPSSVVRSPQLTPAL